MIMEPSLIFFKFKILISNYYNNFKWFLEIKNIGIDNIIEPDQNFIKYLKKNSFIYNMKPFYNPIIDLCNIL